MRSIREVLRLKAEGFTDRAVAQSVGCARSTVQECLRRARVAGLAWPLPEALDEAALLGRLYPQAAPKAHIEAVPEPDFAEVARELTRKHVTRRQLWREYRAGYPKGLGYTAFCVHYRRWRATIGAQVTLALDHEPGEQLFVDYSGDPGYITDAGTGERRPVQLFVAAWGFSHYLYAEATPTQNTDDWLRAHVNALQRFGCVPGAIVPDNTSTAVRRALRYDPEFNPEYREFAEHYSVAVLPARVRKPRDKAKVESAVLIAQRRILAALRDAVFFSLAELNAAIARIVAQINAEPFQKREGTREDLFERYDRPAARALPERAYEYGQWRKALVHRDHHIEVARGYYSVHYSLIGERVEARLSAHTVEIFRYGKLIAAHTRVERPYQRRTIEAHRPPEHRAYLALGFDQLLEQATRIGPRTASLLTKQALNKKHLGETIRNAQGILRLAQDFSPAALEQAAEAALQLGVFNYRALRDLLRQGSTTAPTQAGATSAANAVNSSLPTDHENVRGAKYFH
jgi:transposase